jgi:hypothetical protein
MLQDLSRAVPVGMIEVGWDCCLNSVLTLRTSENNEGYYKPAKAVSL